ncbi:MAG: sodium:calcium antiporter [Deltaproteobacteria bacterium]|nr:sodium:calcium antiporter [Deltaproteobacteria bacterium]MBW2420500.1 sodium:calcium antiporter [Deltaproteobacteria bacterium]
MGEGNGADLVWILVSLVGLEIGTQLVVDNAVRISKHYRVPETVIGLSLLAIGTDLPELVISLDASMRNLGGADASGIITGNAVGSALAQIGFVLGCSGLLGVLSMSKQYLYRHGSALLGSLVLLFLVGLDGVVTRGEGMMLVTVYVVYLASLLDEAQVKRGESAAQGRLFDPSAPRTAWFVLALGLTIVVGSAELAVTSATNLARAWEIDQTVVAILILGLGSSLPEFAISTKAVLQKRGSLSVGNLIGSNIFDTLVPVGVSALIVPLAFDAGLLRFEIPYLFALSLLVLVFFFRNDGVHRRESAVALAAYGAYAVIKLMTS